MVKLVKCWNSLIDKIKDLLLLFFFCGLLYSYVCQLSLYHVEAHWYPICSVNKGDLVSCELACLLVIRWGRLPREDHVSDKKTPHSGFPRLSLCFCEFCGCACLCICVHMFVTVHVCLYFLDFTCVYMFLTVRVCLCVRDCVRVCICSWLCTWVYMFVTVYVCAFVRECVCVDLCLCVYLCLYMCVYVCAVT